MPIVPRAVGNSHDQSGLRKAEIMRGVRALCGVFGCLGVWDGGIVVRLEISSAIVPLPSGVPIATIIRFLTVESSSVGASMCG